MMATSVKYLSSFLELIINLKRLFFRKKHRKLIFCLTFDSRKLLLEFQTKMSNFKIFKFLLEFFSKKKSLLLLPMK